MLAEKYRPRTFADVIGQDKVIRLLQYHLGTDTGSGKAFLVTGPSGSGKTTLAGCCAEEWGIPEHGRRKIKAGLCTADTLRELASDLHIYGPGRNGRKMIELEECHTLSDRAADMLLSVLEPLPAHVLIVATTTESEWAGPILRSRFVPVALQKIPSASVAAHLERVARAESLPLPDEPDWAVKLLKYGGLNLRELLNTLPGRLLVA